jgi:hypothetical protein
MKEGLRGQSHLRWDNYEDDIPFLVEMSDYNQNFKNFMSSVYNEKCLGEIPYNRV